MGAAAEDAVAHIVVVGRLDVVHEQGVFIFAGIAQHAIGTRNDVAANKGTRADFRALPYPRGPHDRGEGGQFETGVQVDLAADNDPRGDVRRLLHLRPVYGSQRGFDGLDPFPRGGLRFKKGGEARQRGGQIEQFRSFHKFRLRWKTTTRRRLGRI